MTPNGPTPASSLSYTRITGLFLGCGCFLPVACLYGFGGTSTGYRLSYGPLFLCLLALNTCNPTPDLRPDLKLTLPLLFSLFSSTLKRHFAPLGPFTGPPPTPYHSSTAALSVTTNGPTTRLCGLRASHGLRGPLTDSGGFSRVAGVFTGCGGSYLPLLLLRSTFPLHLTGLLPLDSLVAALRGPIHGPAPRPSSLQTGIRLSLSLPQIL